MKIASARASFRPEPILKPFGFKGGYLSELWQTRVELDGCAGPGVQSVLWSDAGVFSAYPEKTSNELMFAVTERACEMSREIEWTRPDELLASVFPELLSFARERTGRPDLRPTFVLNALVPLDLAAWTLYARENGWTTFDAMLPECFRAAQAERHARCASIPLITYGTSLNEVKALADEGYFFFKIKIGQPGTQEEMLRKDCERASALHALLKEVETPWTESGRPVYYFDANGRYETKEAFLRFVDHLKSIGAYDRTALVEEPFDERDEVDVHDIPLRLAADESAHTAADAVRRMELGYAAMTLKPIAKTLSVSLEVAAAARVRGVPCFCADLTVGPTMVEWNKAVAARLDAFPGLRGLGLVETNGEQNYVNWRTMRAELPQPDAPWTRTVRGTFGLDETYWQKPFFGGIV